MIVFKNVKKKYKNTVVIEDFNLEIERGKIVALIGESGSGKTTLLKMINKLIPLSGGEIYVNNQPISTWNSTELRRALGYVIQQHGLFPHMTIKENIQIIPRLLKQNQEVLDQRSSELLRQVGLEPELYLNQYPSQLSGGQQQRIGIVRALITNPDIILMDEPFSALDPITREDLQEELLAIQKDFHKTIVFVTHDMDEALKLADKICILQQGKVLQYDTPENILKNPANDYVSNFIGKGRIWNNPELINVMDAAISNPVTIGASRTIVQALEVIRNRKVDSLLVVDKQRKLLGIVTLKYLISLKQKSLMIEDVMTTEVPTIDKEATLVDCLALFEGMGGNYLVVIDSHQQLQGLVTKSSLLSLLGSQFLEEEGGDQ